MIIWGFAALVVKQLAYEQLALIELLSNFQGSFSKMMDIIFWNFATNLKSLGSPQIK